MPYTVTRLAELLEGAVPWLGIRVADGIPGPDWISCAEVVAAQRAGGDPTGPWRASLQAATLRQYGVAPPQVTPMFVLMWYVGVPAYVAAVSSALTGTAPDVAPDALAFRLEPTQHYPVEIALLSDRVVGTGEAVAATDAHCDAFLTTYRPGVKLGTRQRYGAVRDEVRTALRQVPDAPYLRETAEAFGVRPDERRDSCCLIYALPGIHECSTCPRLSDA